MDETLDEQKRRAEIENLIATTIATQTRLQPEFEKLNAEMMKLVFESMKIRRETAWYPLVMGIGAMGAGAGLFAAALAFFKAWYA